MDDGLTRRSKNPPLGGWRGHGNWVPDELIRSRRVMAKNRLIYGNQARNADRNSQEAMILGFIFITGFAAVTVLLAKAPSSRAFFASIAVIGAAYSAYISKTFNAVRESALERYDRVTSLMELEDAFLHAERIVHDTPTMTKSERLILMKEIFEARLKAIQITLENPGQIGARFGTHARRRKASSGRRLIPIDRRQAGERGARLALDQAAGIVSEDEGDEEDPSVG